MPSDRTFVTELATALGTLGDDPAEVISLRPPEMATLDEADWARLLSLWESGHYSDDFAAGFSNGRAFLRAYDALNGRRPRIVEWTGGRRPPGDEVVPSDLRIDHVYLVSCKYLSRILHNPSPARLVEGLLSTTPVEDSRDWYQRVAPVEHQQLYEACVQELSGMDLPASVCELASDDRRRLASALRGRWPERAAPHYARLCGVVGEETARIWTRNIEHAGAETVLWRLLRIGSAPYFILGTSSSGSMRLRIDTPWDWRRAYRLRSFEVSARSAGQPLVAWSASYEDRQSSATRMVRGHVEIRWSHGRFAQPPEAKVYLDTPHDEVPGYRPLEDPQGATEQGVLFPST